MVERAPAAARAPSSSQRLAVLALLAAIPWTIQIWAVPDLGASLVFPWGLGTVDPGHVLPLWTYLANVGGWEHLPPRLLAWPLSTLLLLAALASETVDGWTRIGDPRLTGGLLAFAAVIHIRITLEQDGRGVTIPSGPAFAAAVLWWGYVGDLFADW